MAKAGIIPPGSVQKQTLPGNGGRHRLRKSHAGTQTLTFTSQNSPAWQSALLKHGGAKHWAFAHPGLSGEHAIPQPPQLFRSFLGSTH
jgi:hypothetical protein